MATMIEMANFIYSVSCRRYLIFYVHDLLTQRGNIYSLNDDEDTWKNPDATVLTFPFVQNEKTLIRK
jgi:hypothetical protein